MKDILSRLDKMDVVISCLERRGIPLMVFDELQKNSLSEIVINAVSMDEKGEVSVRGHANGMSDVFKFVSALKKVKDFKKVEARSTRKKKVKNEELTEFEITLAI
jgi:ACT domain-containing protein